MHKNHAQQILDAAKKQASDQHARLEAGRKHEETERNDRRFDAYNHRRSRAGLPELDWGDYCARKHGLPVLSERIKQLAAPIPEHRDNVLLFTR